MLTRFYRCNTKSINDNEVLKECLQQEIKINKFINKGSFGTIYEADYHNMKIAVKIIDDKLKNLNDVLYEVEYSYNMSSQMLGPRIYDAFYVASDKRIRAYILMELFDYSVHSIYSKNLPKMKYYEIHTKLLDIIYSQIFDHHMYCVDIKPANFVVKKVKDDYIVRMIDFGGDWCYLDEFPKEYETPEILYTIIIIQLCLMIKYEIQRNKLPLKLLEPFFYDEIIQKQNYYHIRDVLYKVLRGPNGLIHITYMSFALGLDSDVDHEVLAQKAINIFVKCGQSLQMDS